MSDTIDKKALMAAAEESGRFYPMKGGWRNMQIFAGVLCCLLVLGIPLGVWIMIRAKKAGAGITEEGFGHRYLATVAGRWTDVESMTLSSMSGAEFGGGLVGLAAASAVKARTEGLKGPILVKIRGKRFPVTIPAHTLENSVEMAREMERLSGISFLPREQQGA